MRISRRMTNFASSFAYITFPILCKFSGFGGDVPSVPPGSATVTNAYGNLWYFLILFINFTSTLFYGIVGKHFIKLLSFLCFAISLQLFCLRCFIIFNGWTSSCFKWIAKCSKKAGKILNFFKNNTSFASNLSRIPHLCMWCMWEGARPLMGRTVRTRALGECRAYTDFLQNEQIICIFYIPPLRRARVRAWVSWWL